MVFMKMKSEVGLRVGFSWLFTKWRQLYKFCEIHDLKKYYFLRMNETQSLQSPRGGHL